MTMTSFRPRLLRPLLIAVIGSGLPFGTLQAGAGHDHPESAATPAKAAAAKAEAAQPRPDPIAEQDGQVADEDGHGEGEETHAEGEIELGREGVANRGRHAVLELFGLKKIVVAVI